MVFYNQGVGIALICVCKVHWCLPGHAGRVAGSQVRLFLPSWFLHWGFLTAQQRPWPGTLALPLSTC